MFGNDIPMQEDDWETILIWLLPFKPVSDSRPPPMFGNDIPHGNVDDDEERHQAEVLWAENDTGKTMSPFQRF